MRIIVVYILFSNRTKEKKGEESKKRREETRRNEKRREREIQAFYNTQQSQQTVMLKALKFSLNYQLSTISLLILPLKKNSFLSYHTQPLPYPPPHRQLSLQSKAIIMCSQFTVHFKLNEIVRRVETQHKITADRFMKSCE